MLEVRLSCIGSLRLGFGEAAVRRLVPSLWRIQHLITAELGFSGTGPSAFGAGLVCSGCCHQSSTACSLAELSEGEGGTKVLSGARRILPQRLCLCADPPVDG